MATGMVETPNQPRLTPGSIPEVGDTKTVGEAKKIFLNGKILVLERPQVTADFSLAKLSLLFNSQRKPHAVPGRTD